MSEGWNADYEKGLGYLSRLLSLDRDNTRLLTALVEICTEWFLDCYNNQDFPRLWQGVERYTPLAKEKAVTEQELDNAVQANLAAKAKVEAARAGVETSKAAAQTELRKSVNSATASSMWSLVSTYLS